MKKCNCPPNIRHIKGVPCIGKKSNIPATDKNQIIQDIKDIEKRWEKMGYKTRLLGIYDLIVKYVYKLKED